MIYIIAAFFGGFVSGTNRVLNGQLSTYKNALIVSLINHIVGFIFLSIFVVFSSKNYLINFQQFPLLSFLGGFFGACFVALSSFVFAKLGALRSSLLIISGQMISALIIDLLAQNSKASILVFFGVIFIIIGIFLSKKN